MSRASGPSRCGACSSRPRRSIAGGCARTRVGSARTGAFGEPISKPARSSRRRAIGARTSTSRGSTGSRSARVTSATNRAGVTGRRTPPAASRKAAAPVRRLRRRARGAPDGRDRRAVRRWPAPTTVVPSTTAAVTSRRHGSRPRTRAWPTRASAGATTRGGEGQPVPGLGVDDLEDGRRRGPGVDG